MVYVLYLLIPFSVSDCCILPVETRRLKLFDIYLLMTEGYNSAILGCILCVLAVYISS